MRGTLNKLSGSRSKQNKRHENKGGVAEKKQVSGSGEVKYEREK